MTFGKKFQHSQQRRRSIKKPLLVVLSLLLLPFVVYAATGLMAKEPEADYRQAAAVVPKEKNTQVAAANVPTRLVIDKINVDADIVPVGLTEDGYMDDPDESELVGWYDKSAKLGEKQRAMLLDGHYGTLDNAAVFQRLAEVSEGDIIEVFGGDDVATAYKIVETESQYIEDVDMEKAFYPYKEGQESLTIITCEGEFLPGDEGRDPTYDKRLIVYAVRI